MSASVALLLMILSDIGIALLFGATFYRLGYIHGSKAATHRERLRVASLQPTFNYCVTSIFEMNDENRPTIH